MAITPEPAAPGVMLVVCTANVCRSPLMQETLWEGLADAGWLADVDVLSAGVQARLDQPMCEVSAAQLSANDDAAEFVRHHQSRLLKARIVARTQLVLTAERDHRAAVAKLVPGSQARTFTVREALALAQGAEQRILRGEARRPKSVAQLAELLHGTRGLVTLPAVEAAPARGRFGRPRTPLEDVDPLDVPDGHGQESAVHEYAVQQARDVAVRLAAAFAALA